MADTDDTMEDQLGEMMPVERDDEDVKDTEDGGAMVKISQTALPSESEFYANLAEDMPEGELALMGSDLCELVEKSNPSAKPQVRRRVVEWHNVVLIDPVMVKACLTHIDTQPRY